MRTNQHGFTLIELIVGMVIIGFLWLGVASYFRQQLAVSFSNQAEGELQANVQAVAAMVQDDILAAGFGKINSNVFQAVNSSGTAVAGDQMAIYSTSLGDSYIATFVATGNPIVHDNPLPVRCMGPEGQGKIADALNDPVVDASRPPLFIAYVDPFHQTLLTGVGANPVQVIASSVSAGQACPAGAWDADHDGTNDPIINLTLASAPTIIPRGTTIYGYRSSSSIIYSLDVPNLTLDQNGKPLLVGVADFQVQYFVPTPAPGALVNDLTGVDTTKITQVQFGLVVRQDKPDPMHQGSTLPFTTFDHTITPDPNYVYRQYFFTVRPKNNGLQ